jgi:hypothetical protein
LRVKRIGDGSSFSVPFADFTHNITEAELAAGAVVVDISAAREVVITTLTENGVRLPRQAVHVYGRPNGSALDVETGNDGDVRLLVWFGNYEIVAGGSVVAIEVSERTTRLEVPVRVRVDP